MDDATTGKSWEIDITAEVCPMTFVKTKLLIERASPGDLITVRLKGREPLKNVPRSARELGHEILSLDVEKGQEGEGIHLLRLRKS